LQFSTEEHDMPSHTENRTFTAPLDDVRDAARDALAGLGAEVEVSADGTTLTGATGWTLFSFGENVQITLTPQTDDVLVSVQSQQRVRVALLDLGGRNRKNVGSVLGAMATRLK
jgi:hypothetical protein